MEIKDVAKIAATFEGAADKAAKVAKLAEDHIGVSLAPAKEALSLWEKTKGVRAVGKSVVGGGAAIASATTLTVAATSGAGIASGLAAAGSVVGAGMAAGPGVLAAGPAYLGAQALNSALYGEEEGLAQTEGDARSAARTATNAGAAIGVLGVGSAVVAGGASGAAMMSTLAAVGGVVGGGALAGTAVLVAAPVAVAGVAGYAIYKYFGGGQEQSELPVQSEQSAPKAGNSDRSV